MNIKPRNHVINTGMLGLQFLINFTILDHKAVREIKSSRNDGLLLCAISLIINGIEQSKYDLDDPEVISYLRAIKCYVEEPKLYPMDMPVDKAKEIIREIQISKERSTFCLRDNNRQLPQGNMKEIANKLGISLSEARRLKANGTLHEKLALVS